MAAKLEKQVDDEHVSDDDDFVISNMPGIENKTGSLKNIFRGDN